MANVNLILGDEDDKDRVPFYLGGRLSSDKPVKSFNDVRLGVFCQTEILSMSKRLKTQMMCKTSHSKSVLFMFGQINIGFNEATSSFKDPSFPVVEQQSANQVLRSIARTIVSMSDCKEWVTIPSNLVVIVSPCALMKMK